MCEPVTIGMAVAGGLALGAGAVGSGMKANATWSEGRFIEQQANNNARLAEKAAADAVRRGEQSGAEAVQQAESQAQKVAIQQGQIAGGQEAAMGASGFDLGSGSFVDIMAGSNTAAELDKATLRNNAAREAWGFRTEAGRTADALRTQAGQMRAEGQRARRKAQQEGNATLLGGAGQLIGGIARFGGA